MQIKVMTYNIHHGKGMDKKVDLNRIANIISKSDADIIGLNEVDKYFSKRSEFSDQLQILASKLNYYHEFCPSLTMKSRKKTEVQQYGNGLLSRFPIREVTHHSFNHIPQIYEPRSILDSKINLNGKVVNIYVTHLSLHPTLHRKQSEFFTEINEEPTIILGDWNMKPRTRKWNRILEKYVDVWNESGNEKGFTYPSIKPKVRLDYIFVSQGIEVKDVSVLTILPKASDHLPVLSTLSI